jgi:GT2 family glycosyltransferase
VVAHDGARTLSGLVRALRIQTYPIQRCVGVDTGSADGGSILLAELIGREHVVTRDRDTNFGAAVNVALEHPSANTPAEGIEWIWLLHDDCEPDRAALENLLRAAVKDRGVAVVGPKIRDLSDRRVLHEAGVTIDRAGRRVTGIEPGEIDQGQHDGNRGVLAVSSAGMLVRRDVWEQTGGFDEYLAMSRDDVDFCWRVHSGGHRVQIVTDAVLYHAERGKAPESLDRRNALYVLAVNLPLLALIRVMAGCTAGSLLRAGWFALTKQNDRARAHLEALAAILGHPGQIWRARHQRPPGGYAVGLIAPARTLRTLAENMAGALTAGPTTGAHQATEDDAQFTDEPSVIRRVLAHPGVRLVAALVLVSLIAERRLLAAGTLGGGALVPAWASASGLWQTYLGGFHAAGIGSSAIASPYLAMVAALGTLTLGKTWLAVNLLLLGSVPLAGLTAYLAARRITESVTARVIGAASYALLPVAMGAVADGRLGTAVAIIFLPVAALSAARMVTRTGATARRAAWATGLLLGLMAAFVPVLWLVGVALAAGSALAAWRMKRGAPTPVNAAIAALTPVLVLFPWSLSLLSHPGDFLLEAGVSYTTRAATPVSLLMLHPGGDGLPPLWVTAGLALAFAALLLPNRRRTALTWAGWTVAVTGLAAAAIVSRLNAWPGAELALAGLGLVMAALPAADWLTTRVARKLTGAAAVAALAAAASAPVLAAGFWIVDGVRGPVGGTSQVLPAYVSAASAASDRQRTLILRTNGTTVNYAVARESDPSLGEEELAAPLTAQSTLSRVVATLTSADSADEGDPGEQLADFAIEWVLLPGPVNATLAQRLDSAAGLTRVSTSVSYDLWEVAGTVARARVVEPGGTVVALPSGENDVTATAPAAGGTLLLAEPAGGWTATLNGRALQPRTVDGWAQAFTLPSGGGTLSIHPNDALHLISVILEALAVLIIAVLALPGKRSAPAPAPEPSLPGRELEPAPSGRELEPARSGRELEPARSGRHVAPAPEPALEPEFAPALTAREPDFPPVEFDPVITAREPDPAPIGGEPWPDPFSRDPWPAATGLEFDPVPSAADPPVAREPWPAPADPARSIPESAAPGHELERVLSAPVPASDSPAAPAAPVGSPPSDLFSPLTPPAPPAAKAPSTPGGAHRGSHRARRRGFGKRERDS